MPKPLPIAATFSKSPVFWGVDFEPKELAWGVGAHVYDRAGNRYLDWVSGLGANLLGYANVDFCCRLADQAFEGIGFSLPHVLEARVAEKLANLLGTHVPGWSPDTLGVRFGLSGTDATTMAVRLARAVTGRQRVLSSGYSGWADWSIGKTPPAWGVAPQNVVDLPFNDKQQLVELAVVVKPDDAPAAIILEHPMVDPEPNYYEYVRHICDKTGALLIMDEVVTGFRWALGGASEVYGIKPDIVCYGKALGNGVPISAIVGHRAYFEWFERNDPVFVSSTHFGNALSLAAADAVLDIWDQWGVWHLWEMGNDLMEGLRLCQIHGYRVIGHGPRSLIQFDSPEERAYFIVGMRDRGILMNRPILPNLAHMAEDVRLTTEAAGEVWTEMQKIDVKEVMRERLPRVLFEER
ncbi:hypothetical protein LCGC14_0313140 [marine sediment metagenome]|uniref:Aminotransferase class III-fold pyridoxal phosphate-dependent enzyme n=1 Tax=marine sediment metagenome TaxID=412755 RepID=A0A0F9U409_9ZZZZ